MKNHLRLMACAVLLPFCDNIKGQQIIKEFNVWKTQ
jgi:hypothetical protein